MRRTENILALRINYSPSGSKKGISETCTTAASALFNKLETTAFANGYNNRQSLPLRDVGNWSEVASYAHRNVGKSALD